MWRAFATECRRCTRCRDDGLLDPEAFPILMKVAPRSTDVLFILEAPNRDDTYDPQKRHLTIESDTDPSGQLFHSLFTRELRFQIEDLFVTNTVLCLPALKTKGKRPERPVSAHQQANCREILRRMIRLFDPAIVCPVGVAALRTTNRLDRHGKTKMKGAVAERTPWYGRVLFPLYHTGRRARIKPNGRTEGEQRGDWRSLRELWEELKG